MQSKVKRFSLFFLLLPILAIANPIHDRVPEDRSAYSRGEQFSNEKGKTDLIDLPSGFSKLFIDSCTATNNSGSAIDLGCAWKLPDARWTYWALDDSATPDATEDTTDAQDAGTGDIVLFTTTNNDGHMLCSEDIFSGIGYTVSQDDATNGTYVLSYYNGTDFSSTVTAIQAVSDWTVGEQIITFPPPLDWAVGSTTAVGGPADDDQYCMRVRATTAPSQQTEGTIAWLLRFEKYRQSISDNAGFSYSWDPALYVHGYTKFLCYFSTAATDNGCVINWRGY